MASTSACFANLPLLSSVSAPVNSATALCAPDWLLFLVQELSTLLREPHKQVPPFSSEQNSAREPIHLSQDSSSHHRPQSRQTGRLDGQACTDRPRCGAPPVLEDASTKRRPRGRRTTSPEKEDSVDRRGSAVVMGIDGAPLRATHSFDLHPRHDTHADRDRPHPCLLHSRDLTAVHRQGGTGAIRSTTVAGDAVAGSSERHTPWPIVRTPRSSARQVELCYREAKLRGSFMPRVDVP